MKNLLQVSVQLFFFMLVAGISGIAQKKVLIKSAMFDKFPTTIKCTSVELNNFFLMQNGQSASVAFGDSFSSRGTVTSNRKKYSNLQTIAIRLPEFNNAVFSLSKRLDTNNNIIYSGRIINQLNSDGYELKHNSDNSYQLIKFALSDILSDCN